MIRRSFGLALAGLLALAAAPVRAAPVPVAVAANFTEPAKEIAAAFKAATGNEASLSFGSSGQFYTQITHGAPYQVFLSADVDRAQRAEQEGVGVPGTRFVYATGALVLYSKTPGLVDDRGAVLKSGRFQKLAIADPGSAPYGSAAIQTMTKLGVYAALKPKIVQGVSITQAYQFTATPETLHKPIDQGAILLFPGEKNPAARAFLAFLKGPQAKAIIRRYGYRTP